MNFSHPRYFVFCVLIICACQQTEKNPGALSTENSSSDDRCHDEKLTRWFFDFYLYQEDGHNLAEADRMAWEESEKLFEECAHGYSLFAPKPGSRIAKKQKF